MDVFKLMMFLVMTVAVLSLKVSCTPLIHLFVSQPRSLASPLLVDMYACSRKRALSVLFSVPDLSLLVAVIDLYRPRYLVDRRSSVQALDMPGLSCHESAFSCLVSHRSSLA